MTQFLRLLKSRNIFHCYHPKFYNDSISPVTKIAVNNNILAALFYNDSISPVTKIATIHNSVDDTFYNDSISPVTKIGFVFFT